MIAVVDVEVMVTLVVVCLGVDGDDGCSGYMRQIFKGADTGFYFRQRRTR